MKRTHKIMLEIDDYVIRDIESNWNVCAMGGGIMRPADEVLHLIIEQIKKGEKTIHISLKKKEKRR